VLFAFLLILPFQAGFADISDIARGVYFVGLASSAIAVAFLIAPATYHRINLRRGVEEKERMLLLSSQLTLIGTAFIAIGICSSVFLIADVLFGEAAGAIAAILAAVLFISLWYALPLLVRGPGEGNGDKA
jgi:hypothetical protein